MRFQTRQVRLLLARLKNISDCQTKPISTLTRFNQKTVTVVTENHFRWRISPHLLSEVKEAEFVKKIIN